MGRKPQGRKPSKLGRALLKQRRTTRRGGSGAANRIAAVEQARRPGQAEIRHTTEGELTLAGLASSQHATNALQSIHERNSLDDFLAAAIEKERMFEAERGQAGWHHSVRPGTQGQAVLRISGRNVPIDPQEARQHVDDSNRGFVHFPLVPIPRRPRWTRDMEAGQLHRLEIDGFYRWRSGLDKLERWAGAKGMVLTPFEKNLNVWRVLWRVVEKSDVLTVVVDARNPLLFLPWDLINYFALQKCRYNPQRYFRRYMLPYMQAAPSSQSGKDSQPQNIPKWTDEEIMQACVPAPPTFIQERVMVILNKADLLPVAVRLAWHRYLQAFLLPHVFFAAKVGAGVIDDALLEEEKTAPTEGKQPTSEESQDTPKDNTEEASLPSETPSMRRPVAKRTTNSFALLAASSPSPDVEDSDVKTTQTQLNSSSSSTDVFGKTVEEADGTGADKDSNEELSSETQGAEEAGDAKMVSHEPSGSADKPATSPPTAEDGRSNEEKVASHIRKIPPAVRILSPEALLLRLERLAKCVPVRERIIFDTHNIKLRRQKEADERKRERARQQRGDDDEEQAVVFRGRNRVDENRTVFPAVVGLCGYPNVGKSSTINAVMGKVSVSVSATPGKTKNYQTLNVTPQVTLCDCPGLIFPTFAASKGDLICNGVLPIDRLLGSDAYIPALELLASRVPFSQLKKVYGLPTPTSWKGAEKTDEQALERAKDGETSSGQAGNNVSLEAWMRGERVPAKPFNAATQDTTDAQAPNSNNSSNTEGQNSINQNASMPTETSASVSERKGSAPLPSILSALIQQYNPAYNVALGDMYFSGKGLLQAHASHRGFVTRHGVPDMSKSSRSLVKDLIQGKILYCHPPPPVAGGGEHEQQGHDGEGKSMSGSSNTSGSQWKGRVIDPSLLKLALATPDGWRLDHFGQELVMHEGSLPSSESDDVTINYEGAPVYPLGISLPESLAWMHRQVQARHGAMRRKEPLVAIEASEWAVMDIRGLPKKPAEPVVTHGSDQAQDSTTTTSDGRFMVFQYQKNAGGDNSQSYTLQSNDTPKPSGSQSASSQLAGMSSEQIQAMMRAKFGDGTTKPSKEVGASNYCENLRVQKTEKVDPKYAGATVTGGAADGSAGVGGAKRMSRRQLNRAMKFAARRQRGGGGGGRRKK